MRLALPQGPFPAAASDRQQRPGGHKGSQPGWRLPANLAQELGGGWALITAYWGGATPKVTESMDHCPILSWWRGFPGVLSIGVNGALQLLKSLGWGQECFGVHSHNPPSQLKGLQKAFLGLRTWVQGMKGQKRGGAQQMGPPFKHG